MATSRPGWTGRLKTPAPGPSGCQQEAASVASAPVGSPSNTHPDGHEETSGPPRPLDPSWDQVSSPHGCGGNCDRSHPQPPAVRVQPTRVWGQPLWPRIARWLTPSSPHGCGGNEWPGIACLGGLGSSPHGCGGNADRSLGGSGRSAVQPTRVWGQLLEAQTLTLKAVQPTRVWGQQLCL
jgi:hypothetical protein